VLGLPVLGLPVLGLPVLGLPVLGLLMLGFLAVRMKKPRGERGQIACAAAVALLTAVVGAWCIHANHAGHGRPGACCCAVLLPFCCNVCEVLKRRHLIRHEFLAALIELRYEHLAGFRHVAIRLRFADACFPTYFGKDHTARFPHAQLLNTVFDTPSDLGVVHAWVPALPFCHAHHLKDRDAVLASGRRSLDSRPPITHNYVHREPRVPCSPYPFPPMPVPPISPEQAVELAKAMIAACDGGLLCTIGQVTTLANLAENLTPAAAQALNLFIAAG